MANNKKGKTKNVAMVMVIEDETVLLEAITDKLSSVGLETISCTRGEQALDYLMSVKENPDVIWLDFYLKGKMDGLDFLKKVKSHDKWKHIPVIIVSNTASDQKVKSMLALGATKYLLKAEHRLSEIVELIEDVAGLE